MKNLIYIVALSMVTMLGACGKEELGREFDFSDSLPPYLIINKTPIRVVAGESASVRFTMRYGLSQPVTVTYNVSGAVQLTNQTAVFEKFVLNKDIEIAIPEDAEVASTAVVTLVDAVKEDGTKLTLGRYGDVSTERANIIVVEE